MPKRWVWAGATRPYPGVLPSGRRSPPWTAKRVSDVSAAGGRAKRSKISRGNAEVTENVRGVPQMISDEFGQNLTRDLGSGADLPKSVRSIPMDGDANHGQTVRKSENPTAPSGPDFSSSTTLNLRPEGLRTLLPGFPERKFAFGRS